MKTYLETRKNIILQLGFDESKWENLVGYCQHLWAANEELNLVSRKMTVADLIDNHVIDSLLPLRFFPKDVKKVADFGSGGGLPAVIYAIHFSEIKFVLFEKSPAKQDFLSSCRKYAKNLEIQAEIPIRLPNVDLVTARGFKPIDVLLDVSRDYYKQNGKYFLLKARKEKIDEELQLAKKKFKDLNSRLQVLNSPVLEVERHLVRINYEA